MGPMTSTADTITRLWTAARAMFARLGAAIGENAAIAACAALDTREVSAIRTWIRALEAMVRRIVLIEAIALVRRGEAHTRVARATNAVGAADRCDGARPPAFTQIALPLPSVRILSQHTASTHAARSRSAPSLRLWPKRPPSAGPRVRDVGPALLVREALADRARLGACRQMQNVRATRRPEPARILERVAALARIIERPLAAARRLARKLRTLPKLAIQLAAMKLPRSKHCVESEYAESRAVATSDAYDFVMDSS